MIYLPILQPSSEFRLQADLPRRASTRNFEQYELRHHFNTRLSFAVPDFLKQLYLDLLNFE